MSWISEVGSFSITGNAGGAVTPVADNINIVGSGSIVVTGNPVLGTLTISGGGVSGMTQHALAVGTAGGSITSLTLGTNGTVLTGVTGADPAFSASPTLTTVYATTFDTNVAASAVTLSGTTLSADGTDVDININITAKGAGKVIIDDLQLTTDLAVTEGGTGASTLLDHGVLVGSGTAAVDALAVGATGTVLQGVTGADPAWSTATYPSTVTKGDVLVASANNVVGVVNDVVNAGYILTTNVGAAPSFQAPPASVTYASDAETIAGTVTNKAVAPSNLKAKLGTQTLHALPVGASDSAALNWLSVGATGTVLAGSTGADPSFSSTPTVTTMYATTFDTNVAAAGTTLSGTTWAADGSDANISLTLTPKGTGNLTLTSGDVSLTSGNLKLPASSSTAGQIQIAGNTVFHTYGGEPGNDTWRNLWVGKDAGNFTCSTGVNYGANIGIGTLALRSLTGGQENFALGFKALNALQGSMNNGYRNVAIGNYAGYRIVANGATPDQGSYNTLIGYGSGSAYTGNEYNNIILGNYAGVAGQNSRLQIGSASGTGPGQINTAYICGIYGRTPVGTLNVALVDSNNQLGSVAQLAVAQGGTGAATLTDHGILLGSGTGAITPLGEASNGQIPIGSTGNDPVLATITAGANVTVTNGAGSITVASSINTINDQTDSYQLVASDAGKFITMTKGTANTLTVPKDATVNFAIGTYVKVYQGGAGITSIAPEDGTITINCSVSTPAIRAQYGVATLHKIAANTWVAYGDLD